ncbi:MAG: hypothetical protein NTW21_21800 [Verrucomicrobia bacterium]|nr:hypothetical protein [Verrucomicrobiota bacterium]
MASSTRIERAPEKPEVPKTYTYRQSYPGGCFNGLIAPIQKFAIKGVTYDIPLMEAWSKDGKRILLTFTRGSHPSSPYGMQKKGKPVRN